MDISLSRTLNAMAIRNLEKWFGFESGRLQAHYVELISDYEFLQDLSVKAAEHSSFRKDVPGIFKRAPFNNIDWFGFERVVIYCLIREFSPKFVFETGVFYGGNTAFALRAIQKNGFGHLTSADVQRISQDSLSESTKHPWVGISEDYRPDLTPGFLVPENLKPNWTLICKDGVTVLSEAEEIDFFIHDSDHSFTNVFSELSIAWNKISQNGIALVDDIDWSNGFFKFITELHLMPHLLTDNGKDDLRVRFGLIYKNNSTNSLSKVTTH